MAGLCLAAGWLAPPAVWASSGALSQLPGKAACVSNDAYDGSPGLCRQANGLDGAQSVAISPNGRSLYTAAVQSNAIAAFSRDAGTGLPTEVPGAGGCISQAATSGCTVGVGLAATDWVTVSPDGANVYATSANSQAVDVFARDTTTGALSQLTGGSGCVSSSSGLPACTPGRALAGAAGVTLSPDGQTAYVASFTSGSVGIFTRGAGGALTQLSTAAGCLTNTNVTGCTAVGNLSGTAAVAVSADGAFVYVAARYSQAVTVYARNPLTGALTRLAGTSGCVAQTASATCVKANGMKGPNSIWISPDASHVIVGNFTNGQGAPNDTVAVFARNTTTGTLTEQVCLSGVPNPDPACTPVPVLGGDFAVTMSPSGSFLYVTAYQSQAVSVFSVGPASVTRLPGLSGCVSAGGSAGACAPGVGLNNPHQTILSPDGAFAYVVANKSDVIDVFATVAPASAPPSNSAPPSISGRANPGQTLSASAGTWTGTETGYAYQWQSCDASGVNCTAIAGASDYVLTGAPFSASYTVNSGDVGHTIRIAVTAVNSAGTTAAASAATATVSIPPPSNTVAPSISGTAHVASTLTATPGTWNGSPTRYAYQWQDCDTTGAACAPIAGATASTYTVGGGDTDHTIEVVVTASNAGGASSASSVPTTVVPPANTAAPTISGPTTQGQTLTASTGGWTGSPTSYSYQWKRCNSATCNPITGATASTYTTVAPDVRRALRVLVTATNAGGSTTAASARTALIAP